MAKIQISSSQGNLRIEIKDAFCDWQAMTAEFETGKMSEVPGQKGVYFTTTRKAPTNDGLMKLLNLLTSKGIGTSEIQKLKDEFQKLPVAIVGIGNSVNDTLSMSANLEDAVVDGLRRVGGARWYAKYNEWKFGPKYRNAVQIALTQHLSLGENNDKFQNMPPFPWNQVSERWGMCRGHQIEAARICWERLRSGFHGVMILDEMGTGKTASSLLSALCLVQAGWAKRIICVVPPSLLVKGENWRNDCEKIFGIQPKLPGLAKSKRRKSDVEPEESLVYLYTYPSIRDGETLAQACALAADSVVVFDEMQAASNRTLDTFNTCFILSQASNFSIGLTGTPVKNDLQEFWAQCAILDPKILSFKELEKDFVEYIEKTIYTTGLSKRIAHGIPREITLQVPQVIPVMEKPLVKRLAPMTIRRDRNEVMHDFINVEHTELYVDMRGSIELKATKEIVEVYSEWLDGTQTIEDATLNSNIDHLIAYAQNSGNSAKRNQMGELIMRLARAADDPVGLLSPVVGELESKGEYIARKLREKHIIPEDKRYIPQKARVVERFLRSRPRNERYLVFCANIDTCEALANYFTTELHINADVVTGQKGNSKRKKSLNAFKDNKISLLFCTDVFGTGVNIGFADGVIHYSRPWTDATKNQRESRVLRLDSQGAKRIITLTSGLYVDSRKETANRKKGKLGNMVLEAARINARSLSSKFHIPQNAT